VCGRAKLLTSWPMSREKEGVSHAFIGHACNPSYLEGRDQEDHSSKPAQTVSETLPQKCQMYFHLFMTLIYFSNVLIIEKNIFSHSVI
jgi:hypothetical protein